MAIVKTLLHFYDYYYTIIPNYKSKILLCTTAAIAKYTLSIYSISNVHLSANLLETMVMLLQSWCAAAVQWGCTGALGAGAGLARDKRPRCGLGIYKGKTARQNFFILNRIFFHKFLFCIFYWGYNMLSF